MTTTPTRTKSQVQSDTQANTEVHANADVHANAEVQTQSEVPTDSNQSSTRVIFPRLKNGIYVSASVKENGSIKVATSTHGIEINHNQARSIIEQFTGILSTSEIAVKLDIPITIIDTVIRELLDSNFIDVERNTIKLNNRFQSAIASRAAHTEDQSNDAAFSQLQKRLAPELSYTTWLNGVLDGGVDVMTARQNFGVEIIGNSRTATLLCSILLASGVTNTKITSATSCKHPTIVDSDLGSGSLRTTDLGLNFTKRIEELSREWSLFPIASSYALAQRGAAKPTVPEKNLRIICGKFDSQYIERLLSDGSDHFFIGRIPGHAVTIGPFVQPGKTPCRRCLSFIETARMGGSELSNPLGTSEELPVAIAHQVASLAAHTALKFIDTGECELIASQSVIDFLDPFRPQRQSFPQHPECDCLWPSNEFLL